MIKCVSTIVICWILSVSYLWAAGVEHVPSELESGLQVDFSESKRVFGSWLFNGGFKQTSFSGVNPEYRIAQGDRLVVQVWGGVEYQKEVVVDPKGNIFIPNVGPIKVLGVTNGDLNKVVLNSIKRVFRSNVDAYITLASSQTVKVFVSGMVESPGIYEGQSADSILRYIDAAGGIKENLGSYRRIEVKRKGVHVAQMDLYSFLVSGDMAQVQLQDGDLILVHPRGPYVTVEGGVGFSGFYELKDNLASLADILNGVVPKDDSTHVTVISPEGSGLQAMQYYIEDLEGVYVRSGASIRLSSQLRPDSISVDVLGEHNSATEVVLPWGSSLKDLIDKINFTPLSMSGSLQLYRKSVALRQKEMLMASLSALEQSVLMARSATRETAELRQIEADTVLKWIERAKLVQPKGQVVLTDTYRPEDIVLEQGDTVVIPIKRNLVMIHGEVLFPTAISYDDRKMAKSYIEQAGGATGKLSSMNVLLMKPNGVFLNVNKKLKVRDIIQPGDEIFVLAKPELKALQLTKDISQVIYQVAVSAAVALAI